MLATPGREHLLCAGVTQRTNPQQIKPVENPRKLPEVLMVTWNSGKHRLPAVGILEVAQKGLDLDILKGMICPDTVACSL